jgi:curved DNA-binding protein CbpA
LVEEKTNMDIQRALKILEIDRTASIDDVNKAYKDIVSVWHPDRFTHNPRLKRKAEEKIKDVNIAYETLKSFYAQKQRKDEGEKGSPFDTDADVGGATDTTTANKEGFNRTRTTDETRDRTEAAFEIGTQVVLTAWSYLSSKLRRVVDKQVITGEEEQQRKGKR